MSYIFIARHGPTHNDELDTDIYRNYFAPKIRNLINTITHSIGVNRIYTSPITRCKKTAKIIANSLDMSRDLILKTDALLRFDQERECSCITKHSARSFGHILRESTENVLLVTHSSVLKYVLEGLSHTSIKKFYVNKGSVTVYDTSTNSFIDFNHDWKKDVDTLSISTPRLIDNTTIISNTTPDSHLVENTAIVVPNNNNNINRINHIDHINHINHINRYNRFNRFNRHNPTTRT